VARTSAGVGKWNVAEDMAAAAAPAGDAALDFSASRGEVLLGKVGIFLFFSPVSHSQCRRYSF